MNAASVYLDEIKEKYRLRTDTELAEKLETSSPCISRYRKGQAMENQIAWRIAELLDRDPKEVIAAVEMQRAERSQDPQAINVWRQRLQAVSRSAVSVFFGGAALAAAIETAQHCILCSIGFKGRNESSMLTS